MMDLISDMELDTTMDKVVKQIYVSCDADNCDNVPASILIEFVTPYMRDNLSELNKLKITLDPNDTDPKISSKTFYEAMNDWTNAIKENERENSFTASDDLIKNNQLLLPHENFSSSTPRSSLGYYQIVKNCSGILNMSNTSLFGSINSTDSSNKTKLFEDQINEFQHKIKKLTQELELARNQLTLAEEQNESLLADFNKVTTDLQKQQDLSEKLKREKQDVEGIKEENNLLQKKLCQLESELGNSKKEQHRLLTKIDQLEDQKVQLELKLKTAQKNTQETKKDLIEMKSLLGEKESEIATLTQINKELKCQINEKLEIISFYTNKVDSLKNSTFNLETKYKKKCCAFEELSKSSELLHTSFEASNSRNNSIGGKKQDVEFLKKVLTRPSTSTPNQNEENSINELLSPIKSPPTLYVVDRSKEIGNDTQAKSLGNQIITSTSEKCLKDELSEFEKQPNVEDFNEIIREKDEIIKELKIDLRNQQILCTELRSELKNSKKLKEELDKTIDDKSTKHEQLISELSNCENVNQALVSSIETLKNKLEEKQSEIMNFNDFISSICKKLQEQLPCLGFLLNEKNSFVKLEKLIDLMVEHQQSDAKNKKTGNFGKQQIKFEKLQEKNEIMQREITYLQNVNKNMLKENEQMKHNFEKYEKETKAMLDEQKMLLERYLREKCSIQVSFSEDLEFVKMESQVQNEENQQIILNLRSENNNLLKRIENLHNEMVVARAKKQEQHQEINMNLPLKNQKGLLQQLNLTEKSNLEMSREEVQLEEEWSVFQYFISFFSWRKSNKMANAEQKSDRLMNSAVPRSSWSKFMTFILCFMLIVVIFFLIYVQFLCKMEGKGYICPLDWLLEYLAAFEVVASPLI